MQYISHVILCYSNTLVLFLTHIRKLQLLGYGSFDEYEYEICDDDREEINSVVYQGEFFYFMGRWSC